MGEYIYCLRKKTVEATLLPEGKKVTIALATYLCKPWRGEIGPRSLASMTRAQRMVSNGFSPDFYTQSFDFGHAYKFKGIASFSDTPDLGELCGKIVTVGKKRFVIPFDSKLEDFKHLFPNSPPFSLGFTYSEL